MTSNSSAFQPVLRLPANIKGRDFVVGDIHGAYDLVLQGMRNVGFDADRDRLFCVGDLVDRGNGSARCKVFLQQPYVYAVRGNHDHDVATLTAEEARCLAAINFNGMAWLQFVSPQQLDEIQAALSRLPYVIEVQTARGMVGLERVMNYRRKPTPV